MSKTTAQSPGNAPSGRSRPSSPETKEATGTLAEPFSDLDHPAIGKLVEAGDRLGRYRVGRILGRGGTGDVFLGYGIRPSSQRRVAVKVLQRGLASGRLRQRFENECRILSSLDHPNIASLYDARASDSVRPYVIMEYVDGERIDLYCDHQRSSIDHRLRLVLDVCSAIELAHQKRVVHLDIKPGNILVTHEGVPKLLDFGIAKLLDADEGTAAPADPGPPRRHRCLTNRPMTLGYASPEQIAGKPLTTATDLYSLGMLLYKLLVGRLPFPPEQLRQEEERHRFLAATKKPLPPSRALEITAEDAPPPSGSHRGENVARLRATTPSALRQRLRAGLDAIILRAIAHQPEERHGSVAELAATLEEQIGGPAQAPTGLRG